MIFGFLIDEIPAQKDVETKHFFCGFNIDRNAFDFAGNNGNGISLVSSHQFLRNPSRLYEDVFLLCQPRRNYRLRLQTAHANDSKLHR